ncbi:MAG: molybdopterin-dependent oxidoreductase [Actinobacteria bacterium]|nr:molybdopterin-dependent oxidoreductase [Actinomycetota bacterium]
MIKTKDGKFRKVSWGKALATVSDKLTAIKKKYGSDSIAILSSAKCTNEENFLMSKFARAVVCTNNIDHCARLCHASTVTDLIQTFGSGAMTNSVEDIKHSDDAKNLGIKNRDRVKVESRRGAVTALSLVSSKIKKGVVFMPFHYADSPANVLTNPALDPEAKIPEFKVCAVSLKKI